jgi:hypothetical protein
MSLPYVVQHCTALFVSLNFAVQFGSVLCVPLPLIYSKLLHFVYQALCYTARYWTVRVFIFYYTVIITYCAPWHLFKDRYRCVCSLLIQVSQIISQNIALILNNCRLYIYIYIYIYITASPLQTFWLYTTCFVFSLPYAISGEFKGIVNAGSSARSLTEYKCCVYACISAVKTRRYLILQDIWRQLFYIVIHNLHFNISNFINTVH